MTDFDKYIPLLKEKNEEAFEIVYQQTKKLVYIIIVGIIKDRSEVEDIMQDTYITMLEKINQYRLGTSFQNWLLTIARNKAIDHYRKKQRELLIDEEIEDIVLPKTEAIGEKNILVEEMLNLLQPIEKTIFLFRNLENLKNREIAEILDLPLGTVLWHYSNAVKKIKKYKDDDL